MDWEWRNSGTQRLAASPEKSRAAARQLFTGFSIAHGQDPIENS